MKSMILSIFTALTLTNSLVITNTANFIDDNTPRLIKTNRQLLSETCSIDECLPHPYEPNIFVKSICLSYLRKRTKTYSDFTCQTKLPGRVTSPPDDPCCMNDFLTYCPPEEAKSVGICNPVGKQWMYDATQNQWIQVPAFTMKFCNDDGSGGSATQAYGCGQEYPTLISGIQMNDPCCQQPKSTTTTTTMTTTKAPVPTTITEGRCSIEESESVGICNPVGNDFMYDETQNLWIEVPAFTMRFCYADGSGGLATYAHGCGAPNPTLMSSIQSDDPCCTCGVNLGECVYDSDDNASSKYYCYNGGLAHSTWSGESDCSDRTTIVKSYIYDNVCCAQPL